jgi:hypothetical protein
MAIAGLTHNATGDAIQRLPVSIKVAIGEGPDPKDSKSHPKKLDHFVFKRKKMNGADVVWEPDPEITKAYGTNCRDVGIIFMSDNIEDVFKTQLAWWSATECKCSGELVKIELNGQSHWQMAAKRRTPAHPDGEPWPGNYKKIPEGPNKDSDAMPCGDGCADLEAGNCKPSADLYFQLDKYPMLGAVCRLHTTSYTSISQMSSALQQVMEVFGGLAGVRMMLKVKPAKGAYTDENNKRKSMVKHVLSLELDAQDWDKLIANATEMKKMFAQQRQLIGGRRIEIIEDDRERAPEIAGEFAPNNRRELPPADAKPELPKSPEELAQRAAIHRMCSILGFNQGREDMLLGQHTGNLEKLVETLRAMCGPDAPKDGEAEPAKTQQDSKTETAKGGKGNKKFAF